MRVVLQKLGSLVAMSGVAWQVSCVCVWGGRDEENLAAVMDQGGLRRWSSSPWSQEAGNLFPNLTFSSCFEGGRGGLTPWPMGWDPGAAPAGAEPQSGRMRLLIWQELLPFHLSSREGVFYSFIWLSVCLSHWNVRPMGQGLSSKQGLGEHVGQSRGSVKVYRINEKAHE